MNKKEIEKRIGEAIQGVWVLESKKTSDGRILKPPQVSAVSIYSHRHIVNHWVMEDGGYASNFQEYSVSGSKVTVIDISTTSNKPLWGAEPKAKVYVR